MQRPNIILAMTDDQGWGDVGFNGHDVLQTPHLDRLAADGARFNRFYAAAPVCSTTRGSAITGRQPIGFESQRQLAFMDNRYKLYSSDAGQTFALFDLFEDPGESRDIAGQHAERVTEMARQLERWRASCRDSRAGKDYAERRKPWNR